MKHSSLLIWPYSLKVFYVILVVMGVCASNLEAQFLSREERDSIQALNRLDHQRMMAQLGLKAMRPGPSGDPSAPNAANTDESQAKQYDVLPDPLVFENGDTVKTPAQWAKRRQEIFELFDREVYGRLPKGLPDVKWEVLSEIDTLEGDQPIVLRELVGQVDNAHHPDIEVNLKMTLATPKDQLGPVPIILEFGWNWNFGRQVERPTWKEQLIKKGWAYAILFPTSFQADFGAGLQEGIIGLANKGQPRSPEDWGSLRAWAWGASRAIDFFESDQAIDAHRVGIEGLSRYGKAALVAMAYEPRIAIGFIGSSGAGGAKILRRNYGEQVENLTSSYEYHWFAGNFMKYGSTLEVNDLPVDAHHLVALCAPRPVFISAGSASVEGHWVDAKGMFLGGAYASPVYELLGKKGLGTTEFPPEGTSLTEGAIAFRQHEGGHTTGPNWPYFIRFAARYFD
jgi:hypothetical protein